LLPAAAAQPAWQAWRAAVDPQQLDIGSHRLLPLLYHNLRALGVADPSLPYYKAVYRQTWYKNNTLFYQMAAVLTALQAAGLDTLVLKGTPLAIQYYQDIGLRPMGDFDLLVRTADTPRVTLQDQHKSWRREIHGKLTSEKAKANLKRLKVGESVRITAHSDDYTYAKPDLIVDDIQSAK